MTLFVKSISPKAINVKQIELKLANTAAKQAVFVVNGYERTMRTWKGVKPTFPIRVRTRQGDLVASTIATGPGAEKMVFLDNGTRPHRIAPKNKPSLIFQPKFKAKTRPRVIGSRAGGSSGPFITLPPGKAVNHPGTEAREFSKTIAHQQQAAFTKAMQRAARVK